MTDHTRTGGAGRTATTAASFAALLAVAGGCDGGHWVPIWDVPDAHEGGDGPAEADVPDVPADDALDADPDTSEVAPDVVPDDGAAADDAAPDDAAPPPPPANRFGIGLVGPGDATDLELAADLAGPGGFVKLIFPGVTRDTAGPDPSWVEAVRQAYARDLVPVIRIGPPSGDNDVRNDADAGSNCHPSSVPWPRSEACPAPSASSSRESSSDLRPAPCPVVEPTICYIARGG